MKKRYLAAVALAAGLAIASQALADEPTVTTADGIQAQLPQTYPTTPLEDFMNALNGPLGMGIGVLAVSVGGLMLRDRLRRRNDGDRVRQAIVARGSFAQNPFPQLQSPFAPQPMMSLQVQDMVRAWSESPLSSADFDTTSAPMPLPPPMVELNDVWGRG